MSDNTEPRLPDLRYVRELARVFKQYELGEIEIETGDHRILLRKPDLTVGALSKGQHPALPGPTPTPSVNPIGPAGPGVGVVVPEDTATKTADGVYITSPFVGTFYRSPRPDAKPFVEVGDKISSGDVVCIVEAMKLFNEIEAEFSCAIEEILVDAGQPVEYGANLFRVRKL